MRMIAYAIVAALALIGPPSSAMPAAETSARTERVAALPDGRRINFRCRGQGAPTVLLEGGYGATSLVWEQVQAKAAASNRVCAYDRAGSGFSDPGPFPRDGAAIAADLDQALRAARIKGPFVVVGHSAGGLYVRLFSNLRPGEVVGMVLVDASVEHQDRRFAELFGPGAGGVGPIRDHAARCLAAAERYELPSPDPQLARCTPEPRPSEPALVAAARLAEESRAATWQARVSELDNLWTTTSDALDAGRQSYGDMPLIVLTAGQTYEGTPAQARRTVDGLWWILHDEVAARSTRGVHRLVADSPHMMITRKPDVVAQAISEVIAMDRQAKSR